MAHRASSAIQTMFANGTRVYIYLRLTFRALANPAVFCGISEMVCDTLVGEWDPDIVSSPIQPKVPAAMCVDPFIHIASARETAVEVPTRSLVRGDCFLDNIIKVFSNHRTIIKRNAASVPLAIHVSMRPLSKDEPVPRKKTLIEQTITRRNS